MSSLILLSRTFKLSNSIPLKTLLTTSTTTTTFGGVAYRSYHSQDHININTIDNSKIDDQILTTAIKYIPEYGFQSKCITEAIKQLKYPDSMNSLFTTKPGNNSLELQLMIHWLKLQRYNLEKYIQTNPFSNTQSYEEKLIELINVRLSYNEPILHQLKTNGISQLILPYNLSQGLNELYQLSDDLAYYSGDKSHDFNWYSKRLGIASIYVSSELFMLNDTTKDFKLTKSFVKKRIYDLQKLGNGYNNIEQWIGFNTISLINLIKSQLTRG
ncbi:ubiquinone biosynthesis protein, mitochondrial precursor, putative [Candida dubliniensis CD36]|uniref:Ubiquinone biosynthesis protein n=1 Tax=Candida dubliniensis (strain CD36 / ATCC MYA-646 / CBS 7987 / NCPF 3949 / NRRL Y-17841) TaxID=573826 RepID=B9WMW7_CANDC|nr:ubiquinone biosynthesis protein, mitochondrial precursor, putative [Candida dubliniensis CD36]CAX40433.1 ubiquinone biosynthesis protein, mitochondrial precursor, putative [Candida dubliniensis CD36]